MKSQKRPAKDLGLNPDEIEKIKKIVDDADGPVKDEEERKEESEVEDPDLDELRFDIPVVRRRPFSGKKRIPDALHDEEDDDENEIRAARRDEMEEFDSDRLEFGHSEDEGW